MSFLLTQILVCLLIAGLIGAVIGWMLRGGCSKKLRDCEEEWKMKIGSVESEWNTKLQRSENADDEIIDHKEVQAATLKRHEQHVEEEKPTYSYEEELKAQLDEAQNNKIDAKTAVTGAAAAGLSALAAKGISLSDEKANLYAQEGIDFDNDVHLNDNYEIQELAGLEHEHAQKLEMAGIKSTKDLTKFATDAEATQKLSEAINVEKSTVESWIGKSCLLELPGVDTKTADFMHESGITSDKLLHTNPEILHQEMQTLNNDALIPVTLPDVKSVSLWSKVLTPFSAASAAVTGATAENTETIEEVTPNKPYEDELREKLQIAKGETTISIPGMEFDASAFKSTLENRGLHLSDEKIKLYSEQGIDFENDNNLEDNYDVEAIEGVGPKYAKALKELNISSTKELVNKLANNHDGLDQVSKTLQIQPDTLSAWISMADLVQLPGVDAQAAELMQTVGISSAKELAITNPNSLHSEMVAFNKKSPIAPEVPSAESLNLWSKVAKLLG